MRACSAMVSADGTAAAEPSPEVDDLALRRDSGTGAHHQRAQVVGITVQDRHAVTKSARDAAANTIRARGGTAQCVGINDLFFERRFCAAPRRRSA